jgi:hypothetical protein
LRVVFQGCIILKARRSNREAVQVLLNGGVSLNSKIRKLEEEALSSESDEGSDKEQEEGTKTRPARAPSHLNAQMAREERKKTIRKSCFLSCCVFLRSLSARRWQR